jgi:hypothetical protein
MRKIAALLIGLSALTASPLAAQVIAYQEISEEIVEAPGSERFVGSLAAPVQPAPIPRGIAAYGPFRVLDNARAALVDATDSRSPGQFAAMLRAFPGIKQLEMVECPGTEDDRANLKLGLMIHAQGIATHVPDGGSVRSGAVELFLAGVEHTATAGAEFAVHSWIDDYGREPRDYGANSPENMAYIAYYKAMGMGEAEARGFYAMTNSVPSSQAKWLSAADMRRWVRIDAPLAKPEAHLAKLDSGDTLN